MGGKYISRMNSIEMIFCWAGGIFILLLKVYPRLWAEFVRICANIFWGFGLVDFIKFGVLVFL